MNLNYNDKLLSTNSSANVHSGRRTNSIAWRAVFAFRIWVAGFLALILLAGSAQAAVNLTEVTNFGSNPGGLKMWKYVPAGLPPNAPLVMVAHGCTSSAAAYNTQPGIIKYADMWKFAVVWPETNFFNNILSCFNWYSSPGDTSRDQGEPLSAKQMIDKMIADHHVDPKRVYITGISAGGAFTNIMLAAYPDVFAGGAPIAGAPYLCGVQCSFGLTTNFPMTWGNDVRSAYPGYSGPYPRVSIWQGSGDTTVNPGYMTETMKQWTDVHHISQTASVTDKIKGQQHNVYKDANGVAQVETIMVAGMSHGVAIDPGSNIDQCGEPAAFIISAGICSHYYIFKWFGLDTGGGSTTTTTTAAATTTTTRVGNTTTTTATTTTTTIAGAACFTANNTAHVAAGRAHTFWFSALANGSNQDMGFNNFFTITKLRMTGSNYYVIDSTCP